MELRKQAMGSGAKGARTNCLSSGRIPPSLVRRKEPNMNSGG
jgi:hypothetical protein